MLQKLSFILVLVILLTACGAPESTDIANGAMESWDGVLGRTESPETVAPAPPEAVPDGTVLEAGEGERCDAEYFLFDKATNTVTDEEGRAILFENYSLAEFTSPDPERSEWVTGVLDKIARDYAIDSGNLREYAEEFLQTEDNELFYSYSNDQELGVARHDNAVVSLLVLSSLYSGGTHPNSVQVAYNLDVENRKLLRLEDVITEEGAGELAKLVRAGVDEKFTVIDGGNGLFEDYGATIDNSMTYGSMTPYWYLNDAGLVIFYNQYELGPYAAGIIKVELPYAALEGILLEDYQPEEPDGEPGDLTVRDSLDGCHTVCVPIESEGETLLVGVAGKVYQVQLSEVFWLDDTPISQELVFSARSLCRKDVLQITGGFDDEARSFAIEFIDGLGEHHIYYLHPGKLTKEP